MKKIYITISVLLMLLLAVACNMDSATGLFQEAGQSVKKESYVLRKVIAEYETNKAFLIASDEGIFVYSGPDKQKLTDTVGNGRISRNVIWGTLSYDATEDKYSWKCVYFDETQYGGDGFYYTIDQDGKIEGYDSLTASSYIPASSTYDDGKTIIIYRNSDNTKNYISINTSEPADGSIKETSYTDVSFIGDGYYHGKNSAKKAVYFSFDGSTVSAEAENSNSYVSHMSSYFLSSNKSFYKDGNKLSGTVSKSFYTRVAMAEDTNNVYFILDDINEMYVISKSDSKVSTKSIASLSGIEVVYIDSVVDGKYINVLTSESGAKCINLNDSKIESSWKSTT